MSDPTTPVFGSSVREKFPSEEKQEETPIMVDIQKVPGSFNQEIQKEEDLKMRGERRRKGRRALAGWIVILVESSRKDGGSFPLKKKGGNPDIMMDLQAVLDSFY